MEVTSGRSGVAGCDDSTLLISTSSATQYILTKITPDGSSSTFSIPVAGVILAPDGSGGVLLSYVQNHAIYIFDTTSGASYPAPLVELTGVVLGENGVAFGTDGTSVAAFALVPLLRPREMQSIYFLNRESERVWLYYGMVRTGKNANKRVAGNESSSINRAVAFYRFIVGVPTDQEPPAAR